MTLTVSALRGSKPSPRSYTPKRPHSAQLSQQSQEERVPEGYVKQQVALHEVFRIRQPLQSSKSAHVQRHDKMMRRDVANQQLQQQQQQAHLELTEEMARRTLLTSQCSGSNSNNILSLLSRC